MPKYGLISQTDARTLEKTIDLICQTVFGTINVVEIGIYNGETARGLNDYVTSKTYGFIKNEEGAKPQSRNYKCNYTGIDNQKDKQVTIPFDGAKVILGNSNEIYNQLPDNSQDLIFQDGCHCFSCCVSSFYCYAPKVKVGGFMAWHDTGKHIAEKKDFQHGDKENPLAYISVRKALEAIGLFGLNYSIDLQTLENIEPRLSLEDLKRVFDQTGVMIYKSIPSYPIRPDWELVYDEADETDLAGGVTVFQRKF